MPDQLLTWPAEVDIAVASQLLADVTGACARAGTGGAVVIDLSATTFVDSTGVNILVQGHQTAERAGCTLRLRNVPAALIRLVEIYGCSDLLAFE